MGQLFTKLSPPELVDEARGHRCDPAILAVLRENLAYANYAVTLFPARGPMSHDRVVYTGDLSAEDYSAVTQIRPLLRLEYLGLQHGALVKHGLTGETLMLLVSEPTDSEFSSPSLFSCEGQSEARVYCNGQPVGINISDKRIAAAPPPKDNGIKVLSASMVELEKHVECRALVLSRRRSDGSRGRKIAAYTRVRGHRVSVFRMVDARVSDPIVTLALAWFNGIESMI